METSNDVARMRTVGGNLALDFVNTRSGPPDGPPDDDVLLGYVDLVAWTRHVGLLTATEAESLHSRAQAEPEQARQVYQRALRVRDDLDEAFRSVARGQTPSSACLARLRDDAADALAYGQMVPDSDAFHWRWTERSDLPRPLWPIVHAAATLLTTGPLVRVKACLGCRFLFLDESKNRSRRWCSMADCGTTAKIQKYVARRAASRAGAGSAQ